MSNLWSPLVAKLKPYVPGEQPKLNNLIKLNTNENPYPPSPTAIRAMQEAINDDLRLYPDPEGSTLKQAAASFYGIKPSQVFVGNGSDEVLAHAFQAFFKQAKPLAFPDISYSFYPVYCGLYEIEPQPIPLDAHLEIDINDYPSDCGGIIFPNPNAPTGCLLPLESIELLLIRHANKVVLVDEAYIDFGGETAISLIEQYPNLVVVQTLSKSRSLAGMRVGLAFANEELIAGLERVKNSFNSYPLDRVALAGAVAAFADKDYFEQCCDKVVNTRNELVNNLEQIGFKVLPSSANFVFAYHPAIAADVIAADLRAQGIIVRHFKQPRIEQFLRISIGTDDQNQALITAIAEIALQHV